MAQETDHNIVRISVRSLVEFILRSGDIDNRIGGMPDRTAMQLGSRIHRRIQSAMGEGYSPEVPLSMDFPCDDFLIRVEGRADGIIAASGEEPALIDEIKGIVRPVEHLEEPVDVHLAQAKCYAFIYAKQQNLDRIRVRMSYVNLEALDEGTARLLDRMRFFTFEYSAGDLKTWFYGVLDEYKKWARFEQAWKQIRNESIRQTAFPFDFREGQRELTRDVYLTILREKQLFIQAPTGVGKTLSCVFPSVRAIGEEKAERIFYLTAKTITRMAAGAAFDQLREKGLRFKTVILTAKEKICPLQEMACDPDSCPYAKGHFDRVNDAVYEMIREADAFDRESILAGAEKYRVCPFELSLDIASWMDGVIGDYNYAFDPRAKLKRFFSEGQKGEYIFLVDEAHNLVDRGREMYSASLDKEEILALNRLVKGRNPSLSKALMRVNARLLALKKELELEQRPYQILEGPGTIAVPLLNLYGELDEYLKDARRGKPQDEEEIHSAVLDLYFRIGSFTDILDLLDDNYAVYTEKQPGGSFVLRLFCVNPSGNLQKCFEKGRSSILFSATLLPIDYFRSMLGTPDSYAVYARSCFERDRLQVLTCTDVSTRYTRRDERSFARIAEYILRMVSARKGNYMVFFSSYKMLEDTAGFFELICPKNVRLVRQTAGMSEEERETFLEIFRDFPSGTEQPALIQEDTLQEDTLLGFCVMGSFFGEGIDLRGEQLIGAMVVGPGLPMVCPEQEILKSWFDSRGQDGFRLAYQCPGMNKVMQAAGRVIRTEEDTGVVILLDERFGEARYRQMFPREWEDPPRCRLERVSSLLEQFWERASTS